MPVDTQLIKEILEEMKQQTVLLKELRAVQHHSERPVTEPTTENEPEHKTGLIVISTAWVSRLMGLTHSYAPVKVREIKRAFNIPLREPLTISVFCKATGLKYEDVIKRIK